MSANGDVHPQFQVVAEVFQDLVDRDGEAGAAFAVWRGGDPVVDLWAGCADPTTGQGWQRDTVAPIFSGTKGLVAICVCLLLDRGQLDLDSPVANYWPEFGECDKGNITVGEVLSHRARLPGIRGSFSEDEFLDPERMAQRLAAQPAEDDRRATVIYHPLTYGWLCDALIRQVDGRSVGRFFSEEIADPAGLDIWIGLPPSEESRVASLSFAPEWGQTVETRPNSIPGDELWEAIQRTMFLSDRSRIPWNEPRWHRAEVPAANAIASARSMARLYDGVLSGRLENARVPSAPTIEVARTPRSLAVHAYTGEHLVFGVGFELQTDEQRFGPVPSAFGHSGAGGSMHGAWPEHGLGFSYMMNQMRDDILGDDRAASLLAALHQCVGGNDPDN